MTIDDDKDTRWDDEDFDDFGEVDVEWYPVLPAYRKAGIKTKAQMSKLLDLMKGTPSYVLTGKALSDNPDLVKAKYTRREAKSGGGYRYFYDDHGKSGKNYSVHKEGSKWRSTYHDGDTDHSVGKTGSHDKHPATGSVIGAEHKSKAAAESAIALPPTGSTTQPTTAP